MITDQSGGQANVKVEQCAVEQIGYPSTACDGSSWGAVGVSTSSMSALTLDKFEVIKLGWN